VSIGPVTGTFFQNPTNSGPFDFSQVGTPLWSQGFQQVLFNDSDFCTSAGGVTGSSRPLNALAQNPDGSCTPVVAQGSGFQAGVGSLANFEAAFLANLYVSVPGPQTFYTSADDAGFLGAGPVAGGTAQPTYVSGFRNNPPAGTAMRGYPVVGGNNQTAAAGSFTVNFPVAGVYPIEIDYTECCGDGLSLLFATGDTVPVEPRAFGQVGSLESLGPGILGLEKNVQRRCGHLPVNCATGNFTHTFTDLAIPGRAVPLSLTRTYNSLMASTKGIFGYGWTSSYEMSLSFNALGDATVHQEDGSQGTFLSDGKGGLVPPARVLGTLVKNPDGTYLLTRRGQQKFTFSATGQLLSESDLNGNVTTLSYNGSAQLQTVTDPALRTFTFSYLNGLVSSVSDSANRSVSYGYTGGQLTSVKDANGGTTLFGYDPTNDLTTWTDPRADGTLINTYDGQGRVKVQQDFSGYKTLFSYGSTSLAGVATNTSTSPNGNVTQETYTNGMLTSITKGFGTSYAATWSYAYDPTLGVSSITDPGTHVWTASYDPNGNQTGTQDPLGNTTSAVYNSLDEPTTVTDQNLNATTNVYDASGNLQTVTRVLKSTGQKQVTTYTHNDPSHPGDVTAITDPNLHTWRFTYDIYGDLTSTMNALVLGDKTTFSYSCSGTPAQGCFSNIGLLYSQVSPRGNAASASPALFTTSYTYNTFGEPMKVTDALGHSTLYNYDGNGNKIFAQDANGNRTTYEYDPDNHPTQVDRPGTTPIKSSYDGDGNLHTQTDGAGQMTTYNYDPLDRLSAVIDPLTRTTSYGYDGSGNLTTITDPKLRIATNGYDNANRLKAITYSDGTTPDVGYTYYPNGQRKSMSDGTGTTGYVYDSLNRLTQETNGDGQQISYGYDLANNETSIVYPNGKTVVRAYDHANRLQSITDWLNNKTTFAVDADSNPQTTTFPSTDGKADSYAYNNADQLTSVELAQGVFTRAGFTYTRDSNGQISGVTSTGVGSNETYSYTPINQLQKINNVSTYAYNPADDITQLGNTTISGYAGNEIGTVTSGSNAVTYGYDSLGARTQGGTPGGPAVAYAYDEAQHLISTTGSNTATYSYDGDGLRASTSIVPQVHHYAWDQSQNPLMLTDGSTSYIYDDNGLPVEQIDSAGAVLYYHHDQLGSTRLLTTSTGATAATYTYDAYGNLTKQTGTSDTPLRWAGQYQDTTSGLYYLRDRYYDPTTGQFLTRDALAAVTRQPYTYVNGNSLNYADPSGAIGGGLGGCALNDTCPPVSNDPVTSAIGAIVTYAANPSHFGTIVAVVGGGTCIFVSGGTCAIVLLAGGVSNSIVIAARGGSASEQALNAVGTLSGVIPGLGIARAEKAAENAGTDLMSPGIQKAVNAHLGLPGVVTGFIGPNGC
jgi:RHS repeat-associated protein